MIKLIFIGFIIGIGKIIPGVSGALLAISFGVYEKAVDAIGNFFKNPVANFKFLFPLGLGVVLSICFTSKVILYLLNNYYLSIMLLFVWLIAGGMVPIFKKVDVKKLGLFNYLAVFLSFGFVISLYFIGDNFVNYDINNYLVNFFVHFLIGFIDAATMIIPGISGTAVMMLLGLYESLLELLGSLTSISGILNNIGLFIPYILGVVVTILGLSKLMSYLFKNKTNLIYSCIIGFSFSSIILLLIDLFVNYNIKIYLFVFFIVGFIISLKIEKV